MDVRDFCGSIPGLEIETVRRWMSQLCQLDAASYPSRRLAILKLSFSNTQDFERIRTRGVYRQAHGAQYRFLDALRRIASSDNSRRGLETSLSSCRPNNHAKRLRLVGVKLEKHLAIHCGAFWQPYTQGEALCTIAATSQESQAWFHPQRYS